MKKLLLIFAAIGITATHDGNACTNIMVTRGASTDGSTMVTYSADSHQLYGALYFQPAADHAPGTMLKITEWDSGRPLGEIQQVAHTYQRVGNMNEHQVLIGETTFGGRDELADSTGVVDYGSMIYIALERAKTAREAINVITSLVKEHGYASSGESLSIADKDEVWLLEIIGKGCKIENGVNVRKGAVWVARRVPEGYICSHANQARITTFPLNDPA
ncbi:MAG: C69 family dipeptidase, partial [Rikenellaceae bacterium]|nr:C69 family dipeptidase [Rikenellaceae bacterium]